MQPLVVTALKRVGVPNQSLTTAEVASALKSYSGTFSSHGCFQAVEALMQTALRPAGRTLKRGGRGTPQSSMSFADFRQLFLLLPQTDMIVDYWLRAACPGACDIGGCVVVREGNAPAKVRCPHLLAAEGQYSALWCETAVGGCIVAVAGELTLRLRHHSCHQIRAFMAVPEIIWQHRAWRKRHALLRRKSAL